MSVFGDIEGKVVDAIESDENLSPMEKQNLAALLRDDPKEFAREHSQYLKGLTDDEQATFFDPI